MPKVCSKAAAGPALSRVFTPTNPTPRTLYSACAASSAGASTRHGGHAAYQTLTTNGAPRSEEHTSELQSRGHLVCRLLLDKNKRAAAKGCLNYSRRGDPASGRGTAGWRRLRKSPAATCSAISECTV